MKIIEANSPDLAVLKAVLAVIDSFKALLAVFRTARPGAQVILHHGSPLTSTDRVAFTRILVVEDNVQSARSTVDTIKNYYAFG